MRKFRVRNPAETIREQIFKRKKYRLTLVSVRYSYRTVNVSIIAPYIETIMLSRVTIRSLRPEITFVQIRYCHYRVSTICHLRAAYVIVTCRYDPNAHQFASDRRWLSPQVLTSVHRQRHARVRISNAHRARPRHRSII